MPMTWEDVAYDNNLAELEEDDRRKEIIGQFTEERLRSYYLAHPDVAAPATGLLAEARTLLATQHARAALVFAAAAIEVTLKLALLKPVVHGLIHSEAAAGFMADLALRYTQLDRFRDLLFQIISDEGAADLQTYRRPGATTTLWAEIVQVQKARDAIVHKGEDGAGLASAEQAIDVAATALESIYPDLLSGLGLHLHDGVRVCNDRHAREAFEAARQRLVERA